MARADVHSRIGSATMDLVEGPEVLDGVGRVMAPEPGRRRSSFTATCTRRLRSGTIATALGLVTFAGLSVRLDAVWAVVIPVVVLMGLRAAIVITVRRTLAEAVQPLPARTIQPAVDELARHAGVVPPQVWITCSRSRFGCSNSSRPRFVVAPARAVDDIALGETAERDEALAALAHEIGHCRRPLTGLLILAARPLPAFFAVTALLTFSLRSWALLTVAGYVLVALPALWTTRWAERDADETARELGYGEHLATYLGDGASRSRWSPLLATHPPNRERARLLRQHAGRVGSAPGPVERPAGSPPGRAAVGG